MLIPVQNAYISLYFNEIWPFKPCTLPKHVSVELLHREIPVKNLYFPCKGLQWGLHCLQISWHLLCAAHPYILQKSWETERWKCLPSLLKTIVKYTCLFLVVLLRHNYVKCPSLVATSPLSFWWVVWTSLNYVSTQKS